MEHISKCFGVLLCIKSLVSHKSCYTVSIPSLHNVRELHVTHTLLHMYSSVRTFHAINVFLTHMVKILKKEQAKDTFKLCLSTIVIKE